VLYFSGLQVFSNKLLLEAKI